MICESFSNFSQAFSEDFQSFSPCHKMAHSLMCIRQGHRSLLDYAIEFRTLATDSGSNIAALLHTFVGELSSHEEHLFTLDLPEDLDSVISVTNKIVTAAVCKTK